MPPFPVHTNHSVESSVALDRFRAQHRPGALHDDQQLQLLQAAYASRRLMHRRNWSREAIPRHHSTPSSNTLLRDAACVQSISFTRCASVRVLTETGTEK